jgi:hypothetical protein
MRWWIGLSLGMLLSLATASYADDRKGSPFDNEHYSTMNNGRAIAPGSPIGGGGWSSPISLPSINAASARCAVSGMDASISARNTVVR